MHDIENLIRHHFKDCLYESGGEIYIPIIMANRFTEWCMERKIILYTIEFFEKTGPMLVPYSNIISIDSSALFDNELTWQENTINCNQFIKEKANIVSLSNSKLYFAFVIEIESEHYNN